MNPPSSPTLSIIIVSYNTCDLLAGCLESLRRITDEVDFEMIVVDNASIDGSAKMVQDRFPEVKLIEAGRNVGFAAANNLGLAQARGKFLFFLNPDTIVPRGTLVQLLGHLPPDPFPHNLGKEERRIAVMGAGLIRPDGTEQPSVFEFPNLWREFWNFWPEAKGFLLGIARGFLRLVPFKQKPHLSPHRVECVGGAALMARAEAMREVDGFDEGFFLYHEERDLCYRLANAGWEIWTLPTATVIHFDAQASGYNPNRFPRSPILEYRMLGMDRLYQKHRPAWQHKVWRLRARNMLRLRAWWRWVRGKREWAEELRKLIEKLQSPAN